MKKIFLFGVISLVFLAVFLSGCQTTGKAYVASMDQSCIAWKKACNAGSPKACDSFKKNCVDVYTKAEVDALLNAGLNKGTFMDPKSCYARIFDKVDDTVPSSMTANCTTINGKEGFVGDVIDINCARLPSFTFLVGGESADDHTLSSQLSYTCIDPDSKEWSAPVQIVAYCCEIKGASSTDKASAKTTTVKVDPKTGKASIT